MVVNWNGQILPGMPAWLQEIRRGWWYGDGLFETLRMFEGRLPWLDRHWHRLKGGLQALDFRIPEHWDTGFWDQEIRRIATGNARIRISVWRGGGGFYQPELDTPLFLISAEPLDQGVFSWPATGLQLGLAEGIRLPADDLSAFKTLNAPRYVAAALQARRKGRDDVVLLNASDRVVETTNSNLFWWTGDTLCTPPLLEGCVAGTSRAVCLEIARVNRLAVLEKPSTFAGVLEAEEVFLTNAISGIRPVAQIEDGKRLGFRRTKKLYELLTASLRG